MKRGLWLLVIFLIVLSFGCKDDPDPTQPDNENPQVTIISPGNGSTYMPGATINFIVVASDNDKVKNITLRINDNEVQQIENSDSLFFSTNTLTEEGDYIITARATDASGNFENATQKIIYIHQPDVTAPIVSLLSPVTGLEVDLGEAFHIIVSIEDESSIDLINIYANNIIIGYTGYTNNFDYFFDGFDYSGIYKIYASAEDEEGNIGVSDTVYVNVEDVPAFLTVDNDTNGYASISINEAAEIIVESGNSHSELIELFGYPHGSALLNYWGEHIWDAERLINVTAGQDTHFELNANAGAIQVINSCEVPIIEVYLAEDYPNSEWGLDDLDEQDILPGNSRLWTCDYGVTMKVKCVFQDDQVYIAYDKYVPRDVTVTVNVTPYDPPKQRVEYSRRISESTEVRTLLRVKN